MTDPIFTKEDLRKLREASEGRKRLTEQLYDVVQKMFQWLNTFIKEDFSAQIIDKDNPTVENAIEFYYNVSSSRKEWFWNQKAIMVDYQTWITTIQMNHVYVECLTRDEFLHLAKHMDSVVHAIKEKMEQEWGQLMSSLTLVKQITKEVNKE